MITSYELGIFMQWFGLALMVVGITCVFVGALLACIVSIFKGDDDEKLG